MHTRKVVGIDLGTTNSVIAQLDATDSTIVTGRDEQGRATFPSIVGWDPGGSGIVAGRAAVALRGGGTVPLSSVKRYMGLEKHFSLGPESLSPPEVSAAILRGLRDLLAATLADASHR